MPNHTVTCTAVLLLAVLSQAAGGALPASPPVTVTIIWDASASASAAWPTFRSLCWQTIASLQPGDYLEVISAHAGRPRLRLAQTLRSGDTKERISLFSAVESIEIPVLADARLDQAVDMALSRLLHSAVARESNPMALIVLTDSYLADAEVTALKEAAAAFGQRHWGLFITGSSRTNRDLLIAAAQGLFHWSLLEQARPGAWISQLRQQAIPTAQPEQHPQIRSAPTATKGVTTDQGANQPAVSPSDPSAQGRAYSFRTQLDVAFSGNAASPSPVDPNPPPATHPDATDSVEERKPSITRPQPPAPERSAPQVHQQALQARAKGFLRRHWLWLAAGLAMPLAAVCVLILQGGRQARKWTTKTKTGLKDNKVPTDPLVARLNGQIHHLGRIDHLPVIHVGSGPKNTIRIMDKGISARQLRLYSRGRDLMVQNIGTQAVTVNSLALKPRAKQRLVLPAVIQLTESVKMNLSLLRPKEMPPTEGSPDHGQDRPQ